MSQVWSRTAVAAVSCVLAGPVAATGDPPSVTTEVVTTEVQEPTFLTFAPGDPDRLFFTERDGRILIISGGAVLPTPFVDLTAVVDPAQPEGALGGLAFHPDYETNGFFFVSFTDDNGDSVVARLSVTADPEIADPTLTPVLTVPQPDVTHNLGWIGFGPDGYLYLASGDGGNATGGVFAPDTESLLGKILRIDVNGDDFPADPNRNYAIPDNPFVDGPGLDEIWAYGLRNPWRCSFDRLTGDLWMGDVGQASREEINMQPASSQGGEHYGWNCMEGTLCHMPATCPCGDSGFVVPRHDFDHITGCAVIGGYVYRGNAIAALQGFYLFSDICNGTLWALDPSNNRVTPIASGFIGPFSFGEDCDGELYLVTVFGIRRITIIDCNNNGISDDLDISGGTSDDCNANTIPDDCEPDCNGNGVADVCDIANGDSLDRNGDGVPDECGVPGDLDLDGDVDTVDFLTLLADWGPCPAPPDPCLADLDGNGEVDTVDFLMLLANWG